MDSSGRASKSSGAGERVASRAARTMVIGLLAASVAASAVLGGCGGRRAAGGRGVRDAGPQPVPVQVAPVRSGVIAATVPVVGDMNAYQDVQVAARITGRVLDVTVREGDPVTAGQVLVRQNTTDLEATVRQDQAAIQSAVAQVSQAQANLQIQRQQARQNVLQAQAQLRAAQANYSKMRQGARPEQIREAEAAVNQARANLDNAAITLRRNQSLFAQGAIARADLDTARTAYRVATQQLKNAQAGLQLLRAGNYPQDIAAAAEQVRQQQANLSSQIANQRQVEVRRGEVEAARASVRQARQRLVFDQQQLSYASIRAPINGIVAARSADPGQVVSPGTTVMRVVNVRTMYYEPTISEASFSQVAAGNAVTVRVDAVPGRLYHGRVAAVYPAASTISRVFSLRVTVDNPRSELRPGMYARGTITTQTRRGIVVPLTALVPAREGLQAISNQGSYGTASGQITLPPQQAYVVDPDGKARAVPVRLGIVTATQAEVVGGLSLGEPLIVNGQGLVQPGTPVRVINPAGGQSGGRMASED